MDFSSSGLTHYASLLAFVLALLVSCGIALSQEGNAGHPGYSGASGGVTPQTIDDATLKRTAKAFVKVRRIAASAQQEISHADSDQQKQQIAAQAESDKVDAVKAAGLQPQQYNQVLVLARTDNGLRQKLLSYVSKLEKGPSGAE